jgi:DNA-binding MurR/RpiR family transcriptional regulator
MIVTKTPPETVEDLRAAIIGSYERLSKRLQQIARFVLDEPTAMAVETLAVLGERCGVQPSAIVRFAQSFGYDGAAQMQRVFRDGLLSTNNATNGYGERVRQFAHDADDRHLGNPADVLTEFVDGSIAALKHLAHGISRKHLVEAVKMIKDADTVYVTGFRRSFAVAAYLAYSLSQAEKKTVLVDSVGGLTRQQIRACGRDDLLIAVSFRPYAAEAVELITAATSRHCRVLAISDSMVSPIARPATLALQVRESEIRNFRSLSASMCLAQALVIAYAFAVGS